MTQTQSTRAGRSSYDVVVVGAGPAGTVAAIAHAQQGANVLICEADPRAARRFAGEWLHPTGVSVLDELRIGRLERARPRFGYGFVIHPEDGSDPIEMPYSNGVAISAEHHELVEALREIARGQSKIEILDDARVVRILDGTRDGIPDGDNTVHIEDRRTGGGFMIRAGRVIGADGKRSTVRQCLGFADASTPLSYMASVELRDVTLPREGFGHLVLGGPGPALFYRISDDVVRGCLDLPIALGPRARSVEFLWDGFGPVLQEPLRTALKAALERGPSGWAINRFRPRTEFGKGTTALVGDALGHVHPMTAMGMTLGMLDAQALAKTDDLKVYKKERRGYIPELLSNALYHCFRRPDASATAVRQAMFGTLRADPAERQRTMDIMAGSDPSRRSFGGSFLRIAAQAVGREVRDSSLTRLPGALAGFGEWIQWPAALVVPSGFDSRVRAKSSSTHPIPQLEALVPTAAPIAPPSREELGSEAREVALTDAIVAGSTVLLQELERIAMRVGSVPDATIAGPALSCMRAILSTRMRVGMAARMTLGRRRLAVEGIPRLLRTEPACRHLAELLLVLLDGATWGELPIASLAEGIRALVDCQSKAGGFVAHRGAEGPGEAELTALACRAIDVVIQRRPSASDVDLDRVLERAGRWLRASQLDDGGWPETLGADPVSRTAWGMAALMYADAQPGEPAIRNAATWLQKRADDERGVDSGSLAADARALEALTIASATCNDVIIRTARRLGDALTVEPLSWDVTRELVEALAAVESRRIQRPRKQRGTRRPSQAPVAPVIEAHLEDDWAFCKESLGHVSRTFSRPISLLPPKLEVAVTLGYLLCRIADTIEDHTAVDAAQRDGFFRIFLDILERDRDPEDLAAAFRTSVPGDDAELDLTRSMPRVMHVFHAQSDETQRACIRWVSEMARGMNLYSSRRPGSDGFSSLDNVNDLSRYCYYVAGTVGHLLTDLFIEEIGITPSSKLALALRDRAEDFATGLQLTNILKDVTDDYDRKVTFVPRTECTRAEFEVAKLLDADVREAAHGAVAPLFDMARGRLDEAFEYALTVPAEHTEIRLFCLLPLWMAARTLVLARGNDAMFVRDAKVKISRPEVETLIAECVRLVADDDALRARYSRLYDAPDVAEVG